MHELVPSMREQWHHTCNSALSTVVTGTTATLRPAGTRALRTRISMVLLASLVRLLASPLVSSYTSSAREQNETVVS